MTLGVEVVEMEAVEVKTVKCVFCNGLGFQLAVQVSTGRLLAQCSSCEMACDINEHVGMLGPVPARERAQ